MSYESYLRVVKFALAATYRLGTTNLEVVVSPIEAVTSGASTG